MAYSYIRKALTLISRVPRSGPLTCDWIGSILSAMDDLAVAALDTKLNFGWLRYTMRNVDRGATAREDLADVRRAAKLLVMLRSADGATAEDANTAEGWNEGELNALMRRLADRNAPDIGNGYYLRGSFWGFASQSELRWLAAAWDEAAAMTRVAMRVAVRAASNQRADQDLVRKWFGASSPAALHRKLKQLHDGMTTRRVGITYQGPGVARNTGNRRYQELTDPGAAEDLQEDARWGWQSTGIRKIGVCRKFFNDQTRQNLPRLHATSSREMEVTRGGALVHELTHRYLDTEDVEVPNSVYAFLGRPAPGPGQDRALGYGPFTCHGLASVEPALALKNADSYRLFCEDAVFTG